MRNKIFGAIGTIWGGLIVTTRLLSESPAGNEAYQVGQTVGLVLGALMFVSGIYYFFKKPVPKDND